MTGSNRRPSACKPDALPAKLFLHLTAWQCATLAGTCVPTTIGADKLNFRVRYGKSHLEGGFMLRCFQHLSRPHIATQRCLWQDNWYTSGASIPVLSY